MVILLLIFYRRNEASLLHFLAAEAVYRSGNIYRRSIKRTYMRIDSDLEKSHTKSVASINYTTESSIRVKSCPPASSFLCHSRYEVYQIIMQREKMLRWDTTLSVSLASIRYDNCIYIVQRRVLYQISKSPRKTLNFKNHLYLTRPTFRHDCIRNYISRFLSV